MGKLHTVALAGLETIYKEDGTVKHFSETFLNNIKTYVKDNPEEDVVIIDARHFREEKGPMTAIWARLREASDFVPIDKLIITSHSGTDELYIISRYRKGLPDSERYFTKEDTWEGVRFNSGAEIRLWGCNTAGRDGVKINDSICQAIANKAKVATYGYVWQTSQKKRGDGYYQIPDRPTVIKCMPISS